MGSEIVDPRAPQNAAPPCNSLAQTSLCKQGETRERAERAERRKRVVCVWERVREGSHCLPSRERWRGWQARWQGPGQFQPLSFSVSPSGSVRRCRLFSAFLGEALYCLCGSTWRHIHPSCACCPGLWPLQSHSRPCSALASHALSSGHISQLLTSASQRSVSWRGLENNSSAVKMMWVD